MIIPGEPTEKPDAYFSLWTLTEEGVRNPDRVRETLEKASVMIREVGGQCHLYLAIGGPFDMIGVATGVDDTTIVQVQHAIRAMGTLHTVFLKTKEFSRADYQQHIARVVQLGNVKG